MKFDEDIT